MSRPPRARQPIKDAALELFVHRGVHATGIREIAKQAGCSEAALYRHWTNKEDLVSSLFREHIGEVVSRLDGALASADTFESRIRAATKAAYALYDEQPLVFRFVLLVRHEQAEFLAHDHPRMPQDALTEAIAGQVGDDTRAKVLAAAAMGMFLQVAEFVVYGRLEGPLERYADQVSDLVLKLAQP
ncbi:MAG: TetR/AcrR family transcriptional regulator [Planctomycetota bacterium]|jgi:AcrR family transcriptional regulator|nr:TetR/AcrR family transcriptional regulator [Planctomycetota bacterium]